MTRINKDKELTNRELLAMAGAASAAAYRMNREIERKYKGDPVGETYMKDLLHDMRLFPEEMTPLLNKGGGLDELCDMRGSNRMQLERINRTMEILSARKAEILADTNATDNMTFFYEKRKNA
jgi:hypothetical protein